MRKAGPPIVIAVSVLIGGIIALATARFGDPESARRAFGLGTALCALFLGLQYLILLRMALHTTRRAIESLGWSAVSGEITADGLRFEDLSGMLEWADVGKLIEGPEHFVATSNGYPPIVLPKRGLDGTAQSLLRQAEVRA
ncbi:MAG: YcxB family protein [Novosphingobium sp.]